jgi:hypothetical protein
MVLESVFRAGGFSRSLHVERWISSHRCCIGSLFQLYGMAHGLDQIGTVSTMKDRVTSCSAGHSSPVVLNFCSIIARWCSWDGIGRGPILNSRMSCIHAFPHHPSSHSSSSLGPSTTGFDRLLKPSKTFDDYLLYALQTLAEYDQAIPDIGRLTLIVKAALSAQSLLFTVSLHDPDPVEFHRFFELFVLAGASPEKRSTP